MSSVSRFEFDCFRTELAVTIRFEANMMSEFHIVYINIMKKNYFFIRKVAINPTIQNIIMHRDNQ